MVLMKTTIQWVLLTGFILGGQVQARSWTSADGSKTFNADIKSYDEKSDEVTVLKGYKKMTFKIDVLSEADRKWVIEWSKKEVASEEEVTGGGLDQQVIGAKLQNGVLSKLEGKKFVKYEMATAPDYYVVYYSASW